MKSYRIAQKIVCLTNKFTSYIIRVVVLQNYKIFLLWANGIYQVIIYLIIKILFKSLILYYKSY
jgi:hypothetical protein